PQVRPARVVLHRRRPRGLAAGSTGAALRCLLRRPRSGLATSLRRGRSLLPACFLSGHPALPLGIVPAYRAPRAGAERCSSPRRIVLPRIACLYSAFSVSSVSLWRISSGG